MASAARAASRPPIAADAVQSVTVSELGFGTESEQRTKIDTATWCETGVTGISTPGAQGMRQALTEGGSAGKTGTLPGPDPV